MLFNTWDKNDRKDSGVILYLMQQGMMLPFHDPLITNVMDIWGIVTLTNKFQLLERAV